jgi:uncharacterized membrane protein YkoI
VVVLLAAFAVSQTCQKDQVRLTKDQAIAKAQEQVDFEATRKQIRLLRQGLNARPFWIVSLSVPFKGDPIDTQRFKKLAIVEIDANTGKVTNVRVQR